MCLCDTPYPEIRRKVKNALSYSTVKVGFAQGVVSCGGWPSIRLSTAPADGQNRLDRTGLPPPDAPAVYRGLRASVPIALRDKVHGIRRTSVTLSFAALKGSCSQSWRASQKPVGSVRFNLQAPTVLDSNSSPCQPTSAKARCNYDFTPVTQLVRRW